MLAINGVPVRDVIDVQFYSSDEELELTFERGGQMQTVRGTRAYGEALGLEFESLLFDGIRVCYNQCEFCFVAQMPRGLRRSLYVRDDDYRLSFLTGSFVTLTNLTEADWERIETQGLSPLYVSVHATDPTTRARLLGKANLPDIRQQLARLADLGVEVHTQVVLVPGVNDGLVLEQTVADLSALYPSVASVSLVPVGLTRFQRAPMGRYGSDGAKAILAQVRPWREAFNGRFGVNFVYPSDEFYLLAGARVPRALEYDGFPQIENGVGLVRVFLDDWAGVRRKLARGEAPMPQRMTWVTGTLFAPVLQDVAAWLGRERGVHVDVVAVENRFFGETVTVAGLLTAQDVVATLQGRELGEWVVLPRAMLDHEGTLTL
ncbi:MAG: DUF512 domain-containing protein, partial [Anaerolineae bacterium]